jgi:hypothetical protein
VTRHRPEAGCSQQCSPAEFDRSLISEPSTAGRERAKANGVQFGRKRKLSDHQRAESLKRRNAGETLADIARSYGVHLSLISRLYLQHCHRTGTDPWPVLRATVVAPGELDGLPTYTVLLRASSVGRWPL